MSSERVDYRRRSIMLKAAAEAPAVRASQTDKPENSSWTSKTAFFSNFPAFSDDGRPWKDDDQVMDLMALVVVDDFPAEACTPCRLEFHFTDHKLIYRRLSTKSSVRIQKRLLSLNFGWLTRTTLFRTGILHALPKELPILMRNTSKILDVPANGSGERTLQTVPCPVHLAGFFFRAYDRHYWDQAVEEQALYFNEGAYWSDDDGDNQVFALIVLDHFPTEVIDKILSDHNEVAGHSCLWLADCRENLPDYRPNYNAVGTEPPIDSAWQSPFVGKSIADAANFAISTNDGVTKLTSAMDDVNVSASSGGLEEDTDKNQIEAEFKVDMIGYPADHVGTFFSASDRFYWWDYEGGDIS
ncbi:hypothetical protein Q7P35_003767 [Cladosporium inversicolor]